MTRDSKEERQAGGLSVQTLVIASLSSLAAAVVIHEFWQGGAILGAALTPVIVGIVSELLRRPADRVTAVVAQRRVAPAAARGVRAGAPTARTHAPAGEPSPAGGEDRFGLYGDRDRRLRRRRLQLGILTGLAAFAIAAFVLTSAELVIGNPLGGGNGGSSSGGGGGGGTTLLGGGGDDREERERERQRTQDAQPENDGTPAQEQDRAPEDGTTQEQPAPGQPTPDTPETAPDAERKGQTAPEGTPAPAPTQPPAPTTPPVDPGGAPAPAP